MDPATFNEIVSFIRGIADDQALGRVMQHLLKDDTQVYKQFAENESFKRFVADRVYVLTSQ